MVSNSVAKTKFYDRLNSEEAITTVRRMGMGFALVLYPFLRGMWQYADGQLSEDDFTVGVVKKLFYSLAALALKADAAVLVSGKTVFGTAPECSVGSNLTWSTKKPEPFVPDSDAEVFVENKLPAGVIEHGIGRYYGTMGVSKPKIRRMTAYNGSDTEFMEGLLHHVTCGCILEVHRYCGQHTDPSLPRPVKLGPSLVEGTLGRLKREVAEQGSIRIRDICLRAKLCTQEQHLGIMD